MISLEVVLDRETIIPATLSTSDDISAGLIGLLLKRCLEDSYFFGLRRNLHVLMVGFSELFARG